MESIMNTIINKNGEVKMNTITYKNGLEIK